MRRQFGFGLPSTGQAGLFPKVQMPSNGTGPDLSDLTATTYSYAGDGPQEDYQGITLNADGTKLFVSVDTDNNVTTYEMSTPYDPSTLALASPVEEWAGDTGLSQINDHTWNADGTRIIAVSSGDDKWHWADVSGAYDLDTEGAASSEDVPVSETAGPTGIEFNSNGTELFLGGSQKVWKYTLSTPYDPSTKGSATEVLDVSAVQTAAGLFGMCFAPNGLKFYSCDLTDNVLDQWNLTTAYDLTTATHQPAQTIAAGTNPFGIFCRANGSQIWVSHNSGNKVITRWM